MNRYTRLINHLGSVELMIPSLPPEFFQRISGFLQPYMSDSDEREAWLTQAFYLREPRLFHQIDRAGSAMIFTTKCIQKLLTFECLANPTEHALAALLNTIRYGVGAMQQSEIDAFISQLNGLCANEAAIAKRPEHLPIPPTNPSQSVDTPNPERTPTVFVSYSHDDKALAEKLIADLHAAGHAVWIDVSRLKGGDLWIRAISEGIINSYAFIVLATRRALASAWVQDEITWAKQRGKPIIPLLLDDVVNDKDFFPLARYQSVNFHGAQYIEGLRKLLDALPASLASDTEQPLEPPKVTRRVLELQYLDRLRFEVLLNTERYTPLSGTSQQQRLEANGNVPFVLVRPEYALLRRGREQPHEIHHFDNAVDELLKLRRAVVLGEPGAGKTTTIWKLARELADTAITNEKRQIPFIIRLGKWTKEGQGLEDFIREELGALGPHLGDLLRERRAALLLDGLNEIPVSQRKVEAGKRDKVGQVEHFIQQHQDLLAIVSCRAQDYTSDLGLSRVVITPLDPIRILDFCIRYLGDGAGEGLFERLISQEAADIERRFLNWAVEQQLDNARVTFWMKNSLPRGMYWGDENWRWRQWTRRRDHPNSLLVLARNPYMLSMLTQVYVANHGHLPDNRGELFHDFVLTLLARERLIHIDERQRALPTPDAEELMDVLSRLAYVMQIERSTTAEDGNALTALPMARVRDYLTEQQIYRAGSASLIVVGEEVRFSHQLLQEYFAARYMDNEILSRGLNAHQIWLPDRWWERTNWEEAAILLAGLYSADCTPVLEWLSDANPEVAAMCIARSGAHTPETTKVRLRDHWLLRLSDLVSEPNPQARAAVGRALGSFMINEFPADNRKGVSVIVRDGVTLPDIDWIFIPGGEFIYQEDQKLTLPPFEVSRYSVTYAQFQTFIDAADGFRNPHWWSGLADDSVRRNESAPGEQWFKLWNHPRENVSWYDAIAFCRWLSNQLGGGTDLAKIAEWAVRLPTEFEWEKAARGENGLIYPYGNDFDAVKGNIYETLIGQTSAVGIFSDGASPYGVQDMSGNVWQWSLTGYGAPRLDATEENLRSNKRRVLRGGSWYHDSSYARAVYRLYDDPNDRNLDRGFRLCRPTSQEH